MSELSVQLNIAGRTYPLTIEREDEEGLRRIAKDIQVHIEKLRQTYAVKDNQDLLAMTLLEYATRLENRKQEEGAEVAQGILSELDSYLDDLKSE
ncbi:MAG: cell division protein ZapA [Flavobacteriales bacterium]|nr:cell division protein ZapA [Flavobacteriales bacterium]